MKRRSWVPVLVALSVTSAASGYTQTRRTAAVAATNPLHGNPTAIINGEAIFRGRCASCHGRDAKGLTGPDLTGLWASGSSDAQLFQAVQRGVPGTEMPPFDTRSQVDEIWETLAYLRTVNLAESTADGGRGDAANGERLFGMHCSGCHVVNGRGGVLGPDLSRIGSARPRSALIAKIRGTSRTIVNGYQPVTLVTAAGQQIRGVKKNEDDFSLQVMDMRERLHGYLKSSLTKITEEKQSVMPAYGPARLSDAELDDLLRYIATLRVATGRR